MLDSVGRFGVEGFDCFPNSEVVDLNHMVCLMDVFCSFDDCLPSLYGNCPIEVGC